MTSIASVPGMPVVRLLWQNIAPGRDYHVALINIQAARTYRMPPHSHDFYEMLFVLEGEALHILDGHEHHLRPRDLVLLRPPGVHSVEVRAGQNLQYLNLAFTVDVWQSFLAALGTGATDLAPCATRIRAERRDEVETELMRLLRIFHRAVPQNERANAFSKERLSLLRCWSHLVPLLVDNDNSYPNPLTNADTHSEANETASYSAPTWLRHACAEMLNPQNLQVGVPRLVELSRCSAGHLARVMKAHFNQTPTEWLLQQKLQRAALLLVTTSNTVTDIALDCGFSNLSYFYRCFTKQYGQSPRGYRRAARGSVVPDLSDE